MLRLAFGLETGRGTAVEGAVLISISRGQRASQTYDKRQLRHPVYKCREHKAVVMRRMLPGWCFLDLKMETFLDS